MICPSLHKGSKALLIPICYDGVVECGKLMINVIKEEINTIFKRYGYPELFAKIGIDAGENAIVQYGFEQLFAN